MASSFDVMNESKTRQESEKERGEEKKIELSEENPQSFETLVKLKESAPSVARKFEVKLVSSGKNDELRVHVDLFNPQYPNEKPQSREIIITGEGTIENLLVRNMTPSLEGDILLNRRMLGNAQNGKPLEVLLDVDEKNKRVCATSSEMRSIMQALATHTNIKDIAEERIYGLVEKRQDQAA